MADEITVPDRPMPKPPTPSVTPGKETTEYWLTKVVMVVSTAVAIAGAVLVTASDLLTTASQVFPGVAWLGKALIIVGGLSTLVAKISYAWGRVFLKNRVEELKTLPALTPDQAIAAFRRKE